MRVLRVAWLLSLLGGATFSSAAGAAVIVLYDFDAAGGGFENSAEVLAANVAASAWVDDDGTLTDFGGNPGRALAAKSFDDGNSLRLTVQVGPGFAVSLTGFEFDQLASSSGPQTWQLTIDGNPVADGLTANPFATVQGNLQLTGLTGEFVIAIVAAGASSSAGTYRIDNFALDGTVTTVPLPGALLCLASACAALGINRRRAVGRILL